MAARAAAVRVARMVIVVVVGLIAQPMLAGPPGLRIEDLQIVVTGATPSSSVLLFGISYEELRYPPRISYKAEFVETAEDGSYRRTTARQIPLTSVWFIADLKTGDYAVASRDDYKVKSRQLPPAALRRRAPGASAAIKNGGHEGVVLLFRPKVGAWQAAGGPLLELQSFKPVGSSPPPPDDLSEGDVVIAVDPITLDLRTSLVR